MNIISQIISALISFFTQRQAQKTMEKSMEQSNKAMQEANERMKSAMIGAQSSMSGVNQPNNNFIRPQNQAMNHFSNPIPLNNISNPLQAQNTVVSPPIASQNNVIHASAIIQNFEKKERKITVNDIEYNQLEVDCLIQEKDTIIDTFESEIYSISPASSMHKLEPNDTVRILYDKKNPRRVCISGTDKANNTVEI